MSLMGTLGKVAMGVIVAKGVGKLMGGSSGSAGGSGSLGGLLGGLMGGGNNSNSNTNSGGSKGGLSDIIGGLTGGNGGSAGGLGGLLSSLGGSSDNKQSSGFGDMFNNALQGNEPEQVSDEDEANAEVLLRAMINAAKCDGDLDETELKKITEHLGDVSEEEANFVRQELQAPLNTKEFINSVPRGMEEQVYLMSLMAIDLDSKEEAVYLDQLAKGLNISNETSNQIHAKLNVPQLYS